MVDKNVSETAKPEKAGIESTYATVQKCQTASAELIKMDSKATGLAETKPVSADSKPESTSAKAEKEETHSHNHDTKKNLEQRPAENFHRGSVKEKVVRVQRSNTNKTLAVVDGTEDNM